MNAGERGPPSKTRRKRDAEALQRLGEELARLPPEALDELALPDRLRQALDELGRIHSHEARRRQKQFIGRLMRDVDPAPLQAVIDARKRPSREAAHLFRITENWRDRMLQQGTPALQAFLAAHEGLDESGFAAALIAAREERSGASRRLFRMIREAVERSAEDDGAT